jgi:hypothetical protein
MLAEHLSYVHKISKDSLSFLYDYDNDDHDDVTSRARLQCDVTYAEDNFRVWTERASLCSLTGDMRGRQSSSLLAAGSALE